MKQHSNIFAHKSIQTCTICDNSGSNELALFSSSNRALEHLFNEVSWRTERARLNKQRFR